jgi:hypothetical protein
MLMPFGKHKGKKLEDIDESYLIWIIEKCNFASPILKECARKIVLGDNEKIEADAYSRGFRDGVNSVRRPVIPKSESVFSALRKLAVIVHPDHGGDEKAMKIVNEIKSLLMQ